MVFRAVVIMMITVAVVFTCIAVSIGSTNLTDNLNRIDIQEASDIESDAAFRDVLDTPALFSDLAKRTLLNGVAIAGKRVVCVGWRGHIIYSDDNGVNWTQAKVPVSSDLTAVSFPSPNNGWAVGHDGVVLHSSDGGESWNKQLDGYAALQIMKNYYENKDFTKQSEDSIPANEMKEEVEQVIAQGIDKPFLDVWFENETTGFIVGAFNMIFHTSDGGKSWVPWYDRTENPNRLHFYYIRRIGQDVYICGEQGMILKLDLDSQRFRALDSPYTGTFFGMTGNSDALVVFGLRGNIFRSHDEGISWQKIESEVQAGLASSTITADGSIVIISQGGGYLVSDDNGLNFTLFNPENTTPASAVASLGNTTFIQVGISGVHVRLVNK